jgi:2-methylcitrate dehydratase PrpD
MLMAFGLAGSRACSLAANTGTMTKSSHSGHAARMGIECALLAKMGWTASADVFGPKGFFDTFMPGDAQPNLIVENFGAPYRMIDPGVAFKKYPSNYQTHRSIDAALALREDYKIDPAQIDRVEIVFSCLDYVNRQQPLSGLDAKFSVQYTTAVALLDGEISVESFSNERRLAQDMVQFLPKIEFKADPAIPTELDEVYTIVSVWLKDGRRVSKRVDKLSGWMGSPLTRDERLKKFFSCTRRIIDDKSAQRMLDLVERLDSLPDVVEIMDIARC